MANTFEIGETVICSITVKDIGGAYQDPITSMKITITNPSGVVVINGVAMTGGVGSDGVGLFHYDYDSSNAGYGKYNIKYVAVDGTRTTIETGSFSLS